MISTLYIPDNSFLHRTDPRIKLFLLFVFAVSFFLPFKIYILFFYLIVLSVIIAVIGKLVDIWHTVKPILPLIILVTILTPPFHTDGNILWTLFGFYTITTGGLHQAGILITRFSGITFGFYLYFRTTQIEEFILCLRWLKIPYSIALIITIAFRYIPYIGYLYTNVKQAQQLRFSSFTTQKHNGFFKRTKRLFPTLVSVLIQGIKSIPTLSMALEMRGYGLNIKRTSYLSLESLSKKKVQLIYFALSILFVISPLFMV